MANEKFTLNFTLIDQTVYEMITNQFTPFLVAAHLNNFCASNLSLSVITEKNIAKKILSLFKLQTRS